MWGREARLGTERSTGAPHLDTGGLPLEPYAAVRAIAVQLNLPLVWQLLRSALKLVELEHLGAWDVPGVNAAPALRARVDHDRPGHRPFISVFVEGGSAACPLWRVRCS